MTAISAAFPTPESQRRTPRSQRSRRPPPRGSPPEHGRLFRCHDFLLPSPNIVPALDLKERANMIDGSRAIRALLRHIELKTGRQLSDRAALRGILTCPHLIRTVRRRCRVQQRWRTTRVRLCHRWREGMPDGTTPHRKADSHVSATFYRCAGPTMDRSLRRCRRCHAPATFHKWRQHDRSLLHPRLFLHRRSRDPVRQRAYEGPMKRPITHRQPAAQPREPVSGS
jgi:hypothetical protein